LLVDLVAVDVHGKLTAGSGPPASDARISSRHCKGAPTRRHALPSPENGQYHHQTTSPINRLLRSGRILAKHAKAIDRQAVDWNLVVLKSALWQSQHKLLRHFSALRYDQFNSCFITIFFSTPDTGNILSARSLKAAVGASVPKGLNWRAAFGRIWPYSQQVLQEEPRPMSNSTVLDLPASAMRVILF
jgi:hypothetical protein